MRQDCKTGRAQQHYRHQSIGEIRAAERPSTVTTRPQGNSLTHFIEEHVSTQLREREILPAELAAADQRTHATTVLSRPYVVAWPARVPLLGPPARRRADSIPRACRRLDRVVRSRRATARSRLVQVGRVGGGEPVNRVWSSGAGGDTVETTRWERTRCKKEFLYIYIDI